MNLILIGFRGTGKTVLGKLAAGQLGWEFIDADDYLEEKTGRGIFSIFDEDGEKGFRRIEESVIAELCGMEHKVIAAGGGAVLSKKNVKNMKTGGMVILLEADADTIYERLKSDVKTRSQRPRLTDRDLHDEIVHLLKYRRKYYGKAADHKVDTSRKTLEELAGEIVTAFEEELHE
ncbi:MAG: shikimate kinase [Candidatus Brocadiales bacterium]|nr:shikimate kinase [Candidatus Bathyanammoxibius sp.]MCQ4573631.1 shikimate kinase [Candidatus Bathyanammoxibius amoris]